MAADRPLADRGLVEIKMGRSKFPGKPSKIGNRKRVNLSSCALPEENDSSKAAKNIYLGLSVFNEAFGDNEMVAPGPFHGFSMSEVEEALAEARLQQKEAEEEHKKQGIIINLWDMFQSELFSITSCSTPNSTGDSKDIGVNNSKLSFDGGGPEENSDPKDNSYDNSDKRPSKLFSNRNVLARKTKEIFFTPKKKAIKFQSPRLKLQKLHCSPVSKKSLQSQAAKRLLEKAKLSNLSENNKNAFTEKKLLLPNHSICSSRIMKPNKRLKDDNFGEKKFLRSSAGLLKKHKELASMKAKKNYTDGCESINGVKKCLRKDGGLVTKSTAVKNINSSEYNLSDKSAGKIILREPRLQLDSSNITILEGPFSTPNASSLSPNSQFKVSPMQSVVTPGSKMCEVCEVVRFYKVVEIPKKFGVYCCEFCQKFISEVIKYYEPKTDSKLQCLRGNGLCVMTPVIKSQHLNIHRATENFRCHACWLQLCLKKFKIPIKLKRKLLDLLPVNMQMNINLEIHSICNESTQKFKFSNNIDDFKWLKENNHKLLSYSRDIVSKKSPCSNSLTDHPNEMCLRKRTRNQGNENEVKFPSQGTKIKADCDEKIRQQVVLKGPRVKHVCRSASVALGQPLATFSNDLSPIKKNANELTENCNNCDDAMTTNLIETQGTGSKSTLVTEPTTDNKQEHKDKKPANLKEASGSKTGKTASQAQVVAKPKKKGNAKVEHPVSMDFWECYDPEEICETGFGLIGSEAFTVRALCFLCGSSGHEKLVHCASCSEPYHEFCVDSTQLKSQDDGWKFDWVCPSCTVCVTCGRTSGQQLRCVKCENSYHTECVDRVGGRLLHSPDRPWICSACLRCKSCNGVDVSVFVGNLPLCKACFVLRQKGNYCPLCQRCYEDDDYDSKMMECGQCKCWVHAKCEGLSDEKYQVLSFLPESVEYICRMCCVMPPAPWWLAVEAELKSGYLGVLKALSKNRKACTMLKWSPRKQCTCRQIDSVSRALEFEDSKTTKVSDIISLPDKLSLSTKDENKVDSEQAKEGKSQPASILERKTSIEVISHPTESLKLTLKIMKGVDSDIKNKEAMSEGSREGVRTNTTKEKYNNDENKIQVKKCPSNEENSEDSLTNTFDCQEDSQTSLNFLFKGNAFGFSQVDLPRSLSSPLNPPSDSGIGSTDDELKTNCLTDEESCRLDEQQTDSNSRFIESKSNCDAAVSFLEEKHECFCFLDVDSYNSRSKPFSPNLMSIKKKVTTSEYSSLQQFHQDMERMIETTNSVGVMDLYHQTIKEIFPWFDPKFSRVQNSSQKVLGSVSLESTPVKNTPVKNTLNDECKVLKETLRDKPLDYFYSDYAIEDMRMCLLCKVVGDGPPGDTGRLLYCGQNEWVHCNCALWSGEVFEEIDGSLQNVHSAISRGRSIRCPECNLKGASIGCCARSCQETYHFSCARKIGCIFMDDKTMYCPLHSKESLGKLVQNEKEFEIRRPVYVELDKRKMKSVDSNQIRFAVGALQVNSLGRFVTNLSDQEEAIVPEQFSCTRLFWSCYEPWRLVRYHFTVRFVETESSEGVDFGINFTIDHSKEPEYVDFKLKQLRHFQEHHTLLDMNENSTDDHVETKAMEINIENRSEEKRSLTTPQVKFKKDPKVTKKILDQFETKEEENCLSDNQNTADLLPPDLEEAIFKDLPNDILDGISMQDIFMDIKNDPYENSSKDGTIDDSSEVDDNLENTTNRIRKSDGDVDLANQNEFWNDGGRQDTMEDSFFLSKTAKDTKKSKVEGRRETVTLKTYQKSCNLNWNCKGEGIANKRKKTLPKCHVTVNFLESQERGNMLQELKFTDGLVSISTGPLGSMKDLKSRLDDGKRSIQEEGKENKWQLRLQPRLLQVDGGVDSSSSGSEAGESPQRVIDEGPCSTLIPPTVSVPFFDSSMYSLNLLTCSGEKKNLSSSYSSMVSDNAYGSSFSTNLPQLDGIAEVNSDVSEAEDEHLVWHTLRKRQRREYSRMNKRALESLFKYKIKQCDGGVDSECEEEDLVKCASSDEFAIVNQTDEEPVKCSNCHCTYRTKISYQRHLESCSSDFILSSSEGEISDEESPKKQSPLIFKSELVSSPVNKNETDKSTTEKAVISPPQKTKLFSSPVKPSVPKPSENAETLEVKREKAIKRTYSRKKVVPNSKKVIVSNNNSQPMQQILVQQPNSTPTLIVQDLATPNIIPTAYVDSTPTVGFVTAMDSHNPFGKTHFIATPTPNGIISGNYQFPSNQGNQILGGLCLNPQNVQTNMPAFIIQQPQAPSPLISSQPAPVMMTSEQMMLGSTGFIQDPNTGGMFLTSYNQPVFYNMETVVRNTVMQTNQFVSNVLATTYSQTSTQIFRTSEMEQVMSVPNYIVVGPNPPTEDLICVPTPQTFIPNQAPIQMHNQNFFHPPVSTLQAINAEGKILAAQVNTVQNVQPICSPMVLGKVNPSNINIQPVTMNQPINQILQTRVPTSISSQIKTAPPVVNKNQAPSILKTEHIIKPTLTKPQAEIVDATVSTPKSKSLQPTSRALVDYINNFRSDIADSLSPNDLQITDGFETKPTDIPHLPKTPIQVEETGPSTESAGTEASQLQPHKCSLKKNSTTISYSKCYLPKTKKKKIDAPKSPVLPQIPTTTVNMSPPLTPVPMSTPSPLKNLNAPDKSIESTENLPDSYGNETRSEIHDATSKPISPVLFENNNSEIIKLPEIEIPRVDSAIFEKKTEPCLSMPILEEPAAAPPPLLAPEPNVEPPEEQITTEVPPPTDKVLLNELLPLQENIQTSHIPSKNNSLQKSAAFDNKKSLTMFDQKMKSKRKPYDNNQNLNSDISSLNGDKSDSTVYTEPLLNAMRNSLGNRNEGPKLIFDVISDDGFKSSSTSMAELWTKICDSVQEMRASVKIPPMPMARKGYQILGMQNHGLQHCLEQLRGVEHCVKYKCKYFIKEPPKDIEEEEEAKGNASGCARTERFTTRKEYDMFAWLASKHRQLPKLTESAEETLSSIRRANNLPMAMRYRNLKETAKLYVGVYRSKIHGRGLFCLREIEAGEMVIEYAGEVIRSNLTDKREKYYTDRGIGCYMFRIDDHFVVDATMKGNAARFINHSCEPNCYSRVVDILGKKHIVIFALRKINLMEELTYDYKFPFEDEKISCHCLSKKCKKYLN